jgi:hypothetical protein
MIDNVSKDEIYHIEQIIRINHEKVRHLIGMAGKNIEFLRQICHVKVDVKDKGRCGEDDDQVVPVSLTAMKNEDGSYNPSETFSNPIWKREVQRYVKSATRGGFIKWFSPDDIDNMNEIHRSKLEREFERVKMKYFFDIVTHHIIIVTAYKCICALDHPGCVAGNLEKCIAELGVFIHNRHYINRKIRDDLKWNEKCKKR